MAGSSEVHRRLRAAAVAGSLRQPADLGTAMRALGFVQYDPIRRPAPAQDLILRHRVDGYRLGDLERGYDELGVDEGRLHVYGALPRDVAELMHPRADHREPDGVHRPSALAREILAAVRESGPLSPREVALRFGSTREVNDWGGFSAATTRELERLHRFGLVRVVHRQGGTKVYGWAEPPRHGLDVDERLRRLALRLAQLLAPVDERVLRANLAIVARALTGAVSRRAGAVVTGLLRTGALAELSIDGVRYVWPAATAGPSPGTDPVVPGGVRLLAPFDPIVWDRGRFEHLWGWVYRFEAYTPAPKRVLGYYALPMLREDRVIGWANAEVAGGRLAVAYGFAGRGYLGRPFRAALEADVTRLAGMLGVAVDSVGPN